MKQKIEDFLVFLLETKKISQNTILSYRRDLNKMVDYLVSHGTQSLDKVTATNINSYVLFLEKEGKSSATISRNISSMKTFFHYLLNRGEITDISFDDFLDFIDENPNVVTEFSEWMAGSNAVVEEASNNDVEKEDIKKKTSRKQKKS